MDLHKFIQLAYARHDPAHGVDHAYKVLENAKIIAKGIPMSREEEEIFDWVMAGHDAGDHKMPIEKRLSDDALAEIYIGRFGPDLAAAIVEIHKNCSWSKRLTRSTVKYETLMKILQDSDWIEAIGAGGLERCIAYTTHHSPNATAAEIDAAVCRHIKEKLLLIPAELNYESSRAIADVKPLIEFLAAH